MNKKVIFKATAVIALLTLLSKILGFGREVALAYVFGASSATDAFLVATTLPNMVFGILGGALTVVTVPLYASYQAAGRREEALRLFAVLATLLSFLLLTIILVCLPLTRQLVGLIAPGLPPGTSDLAAVLTAVVLPSVLFFNLANLFAGILNAQQIFTIPALFPVVNNVVLIASIIAGLRYGILAPAWGVVLGCCAAACLQVPVLMRTGFTLRPVFDWRHPGLREAAAMVVPIMIGSGVGQVYLIIDRILASYLPEGSISALNYAAKVVLLPQGILIMALSTAIFPLLSGRAAEGDWAGFGRALERALKIALFIAFPCAAGVAVLSHPVVELLFGRGAFDARAVDMTSLALFFFAWGLMGYCVLPVLGRAFYAFKDTVTPVKVGVITVLLNLGLSLLLIGPLKHGGLALANAIAVTCNAVIQLYVLRRRIPQLHSFFMVNPTITFCLKSGDGGSGSRGGGLRVRDGAV